MIMDEPTNNLGVPEQRKVLDLIRTLRDQRVPVILISHTLPDVFAVTDRIVIMHRGRKVAEMPTSSTDSQEVVEYMVGARDDFRVNRAHAQGSCGASSCPSSACRWRSRSSRRRSIAPGPANGCGTAAAAPSSTASWSTPTASTAPTSATSPVSTRASRRRRWSSGADADPAILVGNECFGTAGAAPLSMRRHLFQDLSLPDQPRDRSRTARRDPGRTRAWSPGPRVGVIGWKAYADPSWHRRPVLSGRPAPRAGRPDRLGGERRRPAHRPAHGLRTTNEVGPARGLRVRVVPDVGRHPTGPVRPAAGHDRAGRGAPPELERSAPVVPRDAHRGPAGTFGLLSPSDRPIEVGDRFTTAFGIWGALTCRAGFVVEDAGGLPPAIGDYVERLVGPYFEAVAEWYEALRIGLPGARSRRSSTGGWATRSSASSSTRATCSILTSGSARRSIPVRGAAPVGHGDPGGHHPGHRHRRTSRPISRTASRSPTRRCGTSSRIAIRMPGSASRHAGAFMRDELGITLHAGGAAAVQHPGVPAAVPAPPGSRHDPRRDLMQPVRPAPDRTDACTDVTTLTPGVGRALICGRRDGRSSSGGGCTCTHVKRGLIGLGAAAVVAASLIGSALRRAITIDGRAGRRRRA